MTTDWSAKAKLTAYLGADVSGAATICCERCHAVLGYLRACRPTPEDGDKAVFLPEPIDGYTFDDGQWKPGRHLLDRIKRTGSPQHRRSRLRRFVGPHRESKSLRGIDVVDREPPSLPAYWRCWNCERDGLDGLNVLKGDLWASLPNPR